MKNQAVQKFKFWIQAQATGFIVISLMNGLTAFSISAEAKPSVNEKEKSVEQELRFQEGDETGNELKALKAELLVSQSEKKAVEQLRKLVKKHEGTRLEPEIQFRLAELYMRRARTERFFEIHKSSETVMSFVPQLVKEASESREIRSAVEIYELLQTRFPKFHSMDVVLFNHAYARQQLGEQEAGEKLYLTLVKEHMNSVLVPDSHLALGEIAYNRKQFDLALERFLEVRKFSGSRVYPYALYKAAWCHYNRQDAEKALVQLEEVVAFGKRINELKLDSKLDLRKEALNDMTVFYGDVRTADKLVSYFMKQAGELDPAPYILRVTEIYKRHSRIAEVETILREFIAKMPNSPNVAAVHEELINLLDKGNKRVEAVSQLEQFEKSFDRSTKEAAASNKKHLADISEKLANRWHAVWKKKSVDVEAADSAERAYQVYFRQMTANDVAGAATQYSYAELLFARGKFREASLQYAAVHERKPEAKLGADAAFAAILSLTKSVTKWSADDEKSYLVLASLYLKEYPTAPYALEVSFQTAMIAYEKERYEEAAVSFKKIGWTPMAANTAEESKPKVQKAQDLYLDILNIRKDYKGLREATQALLKMNPSADRIASVEKIYREAYFAEIQVLEEKGQLKEAVEAYKKFAMQNKTSELAPKAWWNASLLQYKMGDAFGGANTCYQMSKNFPTSPQLQDCLIKSAQTFESAGELELAAKVLLNLAPVDFKNSLKWRETAADFFALSGESLRARTMYKLLADEVTVGSDKLRFLEKSLALAKKEKANRDVTELQELIVKLDLEPSASRIVIEQIEADFNRGNLTDSFNASKKIIGKDEIPKDVKARARFVQAQVLEDEFRKQSVKAKADRLALVLGIKTEKLEKAQKAFQSTVAYGDPKTSVKALKRLADIYWEYAVSVRASGGDDPQMKAELSQLAIPMEEKSVETLQQAYDAALKFKMFDPQVAEIKIQLDKLNGKKSVVENADDRTAAKAQGEASVDLPVILVPDLRIPAKANGVGT